MNIMDGYIYKQKKTNMLQDGHKGAENKKYKNTKTKISKQQIAKRKQTITNFKMSLFEGFTHPYTSLLKR